MDDIQLWPRFVTMSAARKGFVAVIAMALSVCLVGAFAVSPLSGPEYLAPSDHHHYFYMATHDVGSHHVAPFCWRIGVPWLVQATGLPTTTGFQVLNSVSLLLAVGFLYASAIRLRFSVVTSLCIALIYLSSPWTTKMLFMSPWLSDGVFYAMVCVALWSSVTRNLAVVITLTVVGVLVRETALLFPVLYLLVGPLVGVNMRRAFAPAILAFAAGLGVVAIVQSIVPALNNDPQYVLALPRQLLLYFDLSTTDPYRSALNMPIVRYEVVFATVAWRLSHFNAQELNALTLGAWGIVASLLGFLSFRKFQQAMWPLMLFLVFVYAQAIGGTNSQRLLTAGLPVLALMAGYSINSWLRYSNHLRVEALILCLLSLIPATMWYPAMHLPIWVEAVILAVASLAVYGFSYLSRIVIKYSTPISTN